MQCSPSMDNQILVEPDKQLSTAISRLTNGDMSDEQWLQLASLPVKFGGLGVPRASSLALPAFLASATSTSQLQFPLQSSSLRLVVRRPPIFAACLDQWPSTSDTEVPDDTLPANSGTSHGVTHVTSTACRDHNSEHESRLLAASEAQHRKVTVGFSRFAVTSCGIRLHNEAVAFRLGLTLGLGPSNFYRPPWLPYSYSFLFIEVEALGSTNVAAIVFLGHRMEINTGDNRQTKYFFQRLSVTSSVSNRHCSKRRTFTVSAAALNSCKNNLVFKGKHAFF